MYHTQLKRKEGGGDASMKVFVDFGHIGGSGFVRFNEFAADFDKMDPNIHELSKVRKANLLCNQMAKMKSAISNLEENAAKLLEIFGN